MIKKTMFSVPARWDLNLLSKYLTSFGSGNFEVYDSLSCLGPVGSGRSKTNLPSVNLIEAQHYIGKCHSEGITFNYLFNAATEKSLEELQAEGLDQQLETILSLNPDSITIAEPELMRYVTQFTDLPLNVSTIADVFSPEDLEPFLGFNLGKVISPQQRNRDFGNMVELINYLSDSGISLELITTETCLPDCQGKQKRRHYLVAADDSTYQQECAYQTRCNARKLTAEGFLGSTWIRPEDLEIYQDLGVNHFKLTCRTQSPEHLVRTANAYAAGYYDGNLTSILGMTPSELDEEQVSELLYVDNQALDGFLRRLRLAEDQSSYCQRTAQELQQFGSFRVDSVLRGKLK